MSLFNAIWFARDPVWDQNTLSALEEIGQLPFVRASPLLVHQVARIPPLGTTYRGEKAAGEASSSRGGEKGEKKKKKKKKQEEVNLQASVAVM